MPKFIYTYGSEGHPFVGGWTDPESANAVFRAFHPDKYEGFLNCCSTYTEEGFMNTKMGESGSNCGHGCWERITVAREIIP